MSIGLQNEKSLHSSIKSWYSQPGDAFEVKLDGHIIDLVRDGKLFEIQTKNFSAINRKLQKLLKTYQVHLIYPIAKRKWIVNMDKKNEKILSRRRSPKEGTLLDLFEELVRIPHLVKEENFTLEVLLIYEEEVRCNDGKGSKRRKRFSLKDRKLVEVVERIEFKGKSDYYKFLPANIDEPFSNKILALKLNLPVYQAQKITYCLRKMDAIKVTGKLGNELLFSLCNDK